MKISDQKVPKDRIFYSHKKHVHLRIFPRYEESDAHHNQHKDDSNSGESNPVKTFVKFTVGYNFQMQCCSNLVFIQRRQVDDTRNLLENDLNAGWRKQVAAKDQKYKYLQCAIVKPHRRDYLFCNELYNHGNHNNCHTNFLNLRR